MTRQRMSLDELLDWFESTLDQRASHFGSCFTLFASEGREVELQIDADEIRVAGVTNYSLAHEDWLGERDVVKVAVMGWSLDLLDGGPRYVRRWGPDEPTGDIVANVMRVFASIYLPPHTTEVEVLERATRP